MSNNNKLAEQVMLQPFTLPKRREKRTPLHSGL